MSRPAAFSKGLDEDDLIALRRRLDRLLIAVRDWEIVRVNGKDSYSRIEKGDRPVKVDVGRSEQSVVMTIKDPHRRSVITFKDHTIGSVAGEFPKHEQVAIIERWIAAVDAAFGFGVHEDRMSAWRSEIDDARALCAAIVGSTGHRFHATLEPAGGHRGFTLGESDTGIEGGILLDHVNEHVGSMIPSLVVLEHQSGNGYTDYGIHSYRELPDDVVIDIDPDEWPDPVTCLRVLSLMNDVPKPWTCI